MIRAKIRPARPRDAAAVRDLERVVVEASLPIVREALSDVGVGEVACASVKDALRLVAVTEGSRGGLRERVIGMIAQSVRPGSADQAPHAHIRALAVAARYRRQGIGTRLLQAAEAWARQQGMTQVATNVVEDNGVALAFFHRAGYHEERGVLVKRLGGSR